MTNFFIIKEYIIDKLKEFKEKVLDLAYLGKTDKAASAEVADSVSWSNVYNKPNIVNNLTSTSTTDVLSANMGKSIDDNKMDKTNAVGEGSFSINRKKDTTVGTYSTTTGYLNEASNLTSFAQGFGNVASGQYSHAEGKEVIASGNGSHAEGIGSIATTDAQHVSGMFNQIDDNMAEIVGWGSNNSSRQNIYTLSKEGTGTFYKDVISYGQFYVMDNGKRMDVSGTKIETVLAAGETSVSLYRDGVFTSDAIIDIYTNKYGLTAKDITITENSTMTLTFEPQDDTVFIKVIVRQEYA